MLEDFALVISDIFGIFKEKIEAAELLTGEDKQNMLEKLKECEGKIAEKLKLTTDTVLPADSNAGSDSSGGSDCTTSSIEKCGSSPGPEVPAVNTNPDRRRKLKGKSANSHKKAEERTTTPLKKNAVRSRKLDLKKKKKAKQ